MATETTTLDKAISAACSTIGLASLKAKQREAISKFVGGKDVFIFLPTCTGYGKSLFYALLPLVFDYLCGIDRGSIVVCVSIDMAYDGTVRSSLHNEFRACLSVNSTVSSNKSE